MISDIPCYGGRGGKSNYFGISANPQTFQRQSEPESEMDAALGKKGDPKSMDDALTGTNPNYFKGIEWRENCQRCVWAYEAQRRGYDVEAGPRIYDSTETLPYMNSKYGWPHVIENPEILEMRGSRNVAKSLTQQMTQWGEGARAIVRIVWKSGRSGHVFCAEQTANGTVYMDPQTGRYINVRDYIRNTKPGETCILRVDNKEFTSLINKAVRRRS